MTNEQIDSTILTILFTNGATSKGNIACTTVPLGKTLDNALDRLKKKDRVAFDKETKKWNLTEATFDLMVAERDKLKATHPIPAITDEKINEQENEREDYKDFLASSDVSSVNPITEETSAEVQDGIADHVQSGNQSECTSNATHETQKEDDQMSNTDSISKIDAAINAAKGRKDKKSEPRPKLTAEDKVKRDEAKEAEKAEKKAEREKARAEKQATRNASKPAAHMRKVDKAASKLPPMYDLVQQFFNELTTGFSAAQIAAVVAHASHFNRVKATERALNQQVKMGSKVRITGGENRFIGLEGTIVKAQRIRCYVVVEGYKNPIYLFTSDVEVMADNAEQAATG